MATTRTRSVITLVYAVALTLVCGSTVDAQNLHYGIQAHDISPKVADKTAELGAGIIRVVFGWDIIEPACKGCFNWTITDAWRDEAKRTHRAIFATLAFTPGWANGGHTFNYPPLDQQDWYDFVFAVVTRYKDDVFLWGVWNEPNLDIYLRNGDLDTYREIVKTAHAAVRAANPDALVLGPEVSHHAVSSGWYRAVMKEVGDLFDIVTVHWYIDGPPLESMMDNGVRPGARFKSVWLSEVGRKPCQTAFGEAGQALFYNNVLKSFEARRDWWTAVIFYDLYDPPTPMDCGAGITRFDWSNRPAFNLYQAFIRTHP